MSNSKLIVCGCLPKINIERIHKVYNGDIYGGNGIEKLADRLQIKDASNNIQSNYLIKGNYCSPSIISRIITNLPNLLSPNSIQWLLHRHQYLQPALEIWHM